MPSKTQITFKEITTIWKHFYAAPILKIKQTTIRPYIHYSSEYYFIFSNKGEKSFARKFLYA